MSTAETPPERTVEADVATDVVLKSLPPPSRLDAYLSPVMFSVSVLFLALAAGLIHRVGQEDNAAAPIEELIITRSLLALWPIFLIEAFFRFWFHRQQMPLGTRILSTLMICIFPPSRLAGRAYLNPQMLWLPVLGWQIVDRPLRKKLHEYFGVPMIVVALMVLPAVGFEYYYAEKAKTHFGLGLVLSIANSIIWGVFAFEFIVMISAADKKMPYIMKHWMDLAIVILPLVDFLPILRVLRLTKVLQLQQLTKMGRLYRMRGLLMKLWRAILVLGMLQKLLARPTEKRLANLREQLEIKEEEIATLRKEIEDLEKIIAERKAQAAINKPV